MSHLVGIRPLRTGLRALLYRGRHRRRWATLGHLAAGLPLYLR